MRQRLATGLTLQRVSDELDLEPDLLRKWAKQVASAAVGATPTEIFPGHGHRRRAAAAASGGGSLATRPPEEELRRLRRENDRLRMERDFLKKAAAFFAKESR
jgi:transposase